MNRVSAHIAMIQQRVDGLAPDARTKLDTDMDIEPTEHFAFQEEQARAHAMGKLAPDEAMIVYVALGEIQYSGNGGWAKGTSLATKVSVTLLMGELLRSRLGAQAR